jgi:hypothetical protein
MLPIITISSKTRRRRRKEKGKKTPNALNTMAQSTSIVFLALSALGFLTLWALMTGNGTLLALIISAWTGTFPDGAKLKSSYTGLVIIDFPLSILVAFFYGLQSLEEVAPFLMLLDLVAALSVINLMTVVESRRSPPASWLRL